MDIGKTKTCAGRWRKGWKNSFIPLIYCKNLLREENISSKTFNFWEAVKHTASMFLFRLFKGVLKEEKLY